MAYWIAHNSNRSYSNSHRCFQCDFTRDIDKLPTSKKIGVKENNDTLSTNPCAPGSECFCFEDNSIWLLGMETDKWIRVGYKYGGSSNSGGPSGGNTSSITSYDQLKDIRN